MLELVVQVEGPQALAAALEVGVGGVALNLPRSPTPDWWSQAEACQAAARRRGIRLYLVWDRLVWEGQWAEALKSLARVAQMSPEALVIRDMGLYGAARQRYPHLKLHAAGGWGCHNSLGLHQAQALGFSRVVVAAPLGLKELALMRRQSTLPVEVVLPHFCPGFKGLCRLEEYLPNGCQTCVGSLLPPRNLAETWSAALEMLSGLPHLGVEAVQVAGVFSQGEALRQVVQLIRTLWEAPPAERSQVLAAARERLAAFGERFRGEIQAPEKGKAGEPTPGAATAKSSPRQPDRGLGSWPPGRLWLETRSFGEAAELAREWRQPLVVQLTPENYAAFLPQHRRWEPRRLVWRLPPVIREASLAFYHKALDTLRQAGYRRFVASDWGALKLLRHPEVEVYGDQTLGVRNSEALKTARQAGAVRVCLPPGNPKDWQQLLAQGPKGSFWTYLCHFPALAVFPREAVAGRAPVRAPWGEKLRWLTEGELVFLGRQSAEHLPLESKERWLKTRQLQPLVLALPHSGLPWGQVPAWVASPPKRRPGPRM